jgi:hypothetical protein
MQCNIELIDQEVDETMTSPKQHLEDAERPELSMKSINEVFSLAGKLTELESNLSG